MKTFPDQRPADYEEIRDEIRSGDLLMCSGSAAFSRMIQWATSSCWSHVGLIWRMDSIDRILVLEAVESIGVRTIPLRNYVEDYNGEGDAYPGGLVIMRHQGFENLVKQAELIQFGQYAIDRLGYPYDRRQIINIAARLMGSLTDRDKTFPVKSDPRAYICSEYVWCCFRELDLELEARRGEFIAPSHIAEDPAMALQWVLQPQ